MQACSFPLKEMLNFDRLGITSDSWQRYPILRFDEVPGVETMLLSRPD